MTDSSLIRFLKEKKDFILGLLASLAVVLVYVLYIYNKTFPITEGWYSVYSHYINQGAMPYKDFFFIFPPLYAMIMSKVAAIFGNTIIVFRLFGVVIVSLITVNLYLIYSKFFKPFASFVSAVTAMYFAFAESSYVLYDYTRVFDLFTLLTVLFFLNYIINYKSKISNLYLFFAGIFSLSSALCRQSSGILLIMYILCVFMALFFFLDKKKLAGNCASYIAGLLLPLLVLVFWLVANNSLATFINSTLVDAASAKGGMLQILTSWFGNLFKDCSFLFIVFVALFAVVNLVLKKVFKSDEENNCETSLIIGTAVAFSGVIAYLISDVFLTQTLLNGIFPLFRNPIFLLNLIAFIIFVVKYIKKQTNLHYLVITGFVVTIGFGCGTSGGLSEAQVALGLGLIIGFLFNLSEGHQFDFCMKVFLSAVCLFMICSIVSNKLIYPYYWWSVTSPDVREAICTVDIKELKGIKVDEHTKRVLETVTNSIRENSNKNDNVFVFSNAPIFYLFADRYPVTKALTHWFDIAPDNVTISDISRLKENKPSVIVVFDVPAMAFDVHEKLFRNNKISSQREMDNFLKQVTQKPQYSLIVKDKFNEEISYSIWRKNIGLQK